MLSEPCLWVWRKIYDRGSYLETIYGLGSLSKVIVGGVYFVLDAASCTSDTDDAATSSGENAADVAGCRQHQLRFKVCRH